MGVCALEPEGVLFAMPFSAHTHSVVLHVHFPPTGLYDGVRVSHAHNSSWIPVTRGDDKVAVGDLTPGSEYDLIVFVTSGEKTSVGYHVHHVKTCECVCGCVCVGVCVCVCVLGITSTMLKHVSVCVGYHVLHVKHVSVCVGVCVCVCVLGITSSMLKHVSVCVCVCV